jgi:putative flavoprotein involved in K+ transport
MADLKLGRLLDTIDEWAITSGLDADVPPPTRPEPTAVPASPLLTLPLRTGEIKTVLWCTGYKPDYSWLEVPVVDAKGWVSHDGGVVSASPGLYVMGTTFLRRRKSTFIDGVGDDARELADHMVGYLDQVASVT